jgi:hypothetical protein
MRGETRTFAGPDPEPYIPACTDGPWVLYHLADGRPWLYTAPDWASVRYAVLFGAMNIVPARALVAFVGVRDWTALVEEIGANSKWVDFDGGLAFEVVAGYGLPLVITCTERT